MVRTPAPSVSAPYRPAAALTLEGAGVWLVIPCYKVGDHILNVLTKAPAWVEGIVCVDDACPDGSGDLIEASVTDPRVFVLRLAINQGVGGATLAGYAEAVRRGARVLVKVDGDDQMDLGYMAHLVAPILLGEADYAKGNRFTLLTHLTAMPTVRVLGNALLSFAAKLSTGYWNIFDPTNGYTALEAKVARLILERRIAQRFFFETDLLYHLGVLRAVVRDVPMPAKYEDETSRLRIGRIALSFPIKYLRAMVKRLFYSYFLRDFNAATVQFVLALLIGTAGVAFGVDKWMESNATGVPATSGAVMLAALPVMVAVQLLLAALQYDLQNVPREPLQQRL